MSSYDPPPGVPFVAVTRAEVQADTDCERRPIWAAMARVLDGANADPEKLTGVEDAFTSAILRGGPGIYRVTWWGSVRTLSLSRVGCTVARVSL